MDYFRKIKHFLALLLLLGLSTAYKYDEAIAPSSFRNLSVSAPVKSIWSRAVNNFQKSHYDEAISLFEELVSNSENPKIAEMSMFMLADCYYYKLRPTLVSDFLRVLKAYQTAIQKYPASPEVPRAYLQIGLIYQQMDYNYEALAYYNLVQKNYYNSPFISYASLYKGKLFLARREFGNARREFETVISSYPQSEAADDTYLNLITLNIQEGKAEEAAQALDKLVRLRPDAFRTWPVLLLYQGQIRMATKQYFDARMDLLRYINVNPSSEKDDIALYEMADAYEKEGKLQEALRLFYYLNQTYPQTEGAILARYRLVERLQLPKQIVQKEASFDEGAYLTVMDKYPAHPLAEEAMARLVLRYCATRKNGSALSWAARFAQKYPNSTMKNTVLDLGAESMATEAADLRSKKKFVDIIILYQKYNSLCSAMKDGRFYCCLGEAFRKLSFYDQSSCFFKQADSLGLKEDGFSFLLDWAAAEQGRRDFAAAGNLLKRIVYNCRNDKILEEAEQMMGTNYILSGDWRSGTAHFSQMYQKKPYAGASFLYSWARCAVGAGDYKQARDVLPLLLARLNSERQAELNDQAADLWINLGDSERTSNIEQAIKDYSSALAFTISIQKRNEIRYHLGNCYLALGRTGDAEKEFSAVRQSGDELWRRIAEGRLKGIKVSRLLAERKIMEN